MKLISDEQIKTVWAALTRALNKVDAKNWDSSYHWKIQEAMQIIDQLQPNVSAPKRQQAAMDEREQSDEVTHDEAMECVIGISIHPHPTFLSHKLRDYIRQQSRASLGHELTGVGE